MRRSRLPLIALLLLFAARGAWACSCAGMDVPTARRHADVVFVGRVLEIQHAGFESSITFEVHQAWDGDPGRRVTVVTSGMCGYYGGVAGELYVIFARDDDQSRLWTGMCSNNQHLACAGSTLQQLGRPRVRYRSVPSPMKLGTDQSPIPVASGCASWPVRSSGGPPPLERGVSIRDLALTVRKDGTVGDVEFTLLCEEPARCTAETKERLRQMIEAWTYEPPVAAGRRAAVRVGPLP